MAASNSNHRGTMAPGIQLGSAWFQRKINLRPQHRGVHLVTEEILRQMPEIGQFSVGLCHVQSKKMHFLSTHLHIYFSLCTYMNKYFFFVETFHPLKSFFYYYFYFALYLQLEFFNNELYKKKNHLVAR